MALRIGAPRTCRIQRMSRSAAMPTGPRSSSGWLARTSSCTISSRAGSTTKSCSSICGGSRASTKSSSPRSSACTSVSEGATSIDTSTEGVCVLSCCTAGTSCPSAGPVTAPTRTTPPRPVRRSVKSSASRARSCCSRRACRASRAPAGVGSIPLGVRWNSLVPSWRSRSVSSRDAAGWVIRQSEAATCSCP